MARLLKRVFAAGAAAAILLLVAQSTILPGVIEQILKRTFTRFGLPARELTIRALSWRQADFSDVVLGEHAQIKIDTLKTDFDWRSLLNGRLHAIRISGAQVIVAPGALLQARPARTAIQAASNTPALPFERLEVTSSSLLVLNRNIRWRIPIEGCLTRHEGTLEGRALMEVLGGQIDLAGHLASESGAHAGSARFHGLSPALLPAFFLPAHFTTPVQGTLHGEISAARQNTRQPWSVETDINFRLSGHFHEVPFQFNQGRLQGQGTYGPEGEWTHVQGSMAIEEAQVDEYALRGLALQIVSRERQLHIALTGDGSNWSFSDARIELDDYNRVFALFPADSRQEPQPAVSLRVEGFESSIGRMWLAADQLLIEAAILREDRLMRLDEARIEIRNAAYSKGHLNGTGIDASLFIDEFMPLTWRNTQLIRVREMNCGQYKLQNGVVQLKSEGRRVFSVDQCDWIWCGGQLSSRPFPLSLDSPETRFMVFFEGLALDEVFQTLLPGQLSGEGAVYGRLPVRLRLHPELGISFGNGHLYTVPAFGVASVLDPEIVSKMLMGTDFQAIPKGDDLALRQLRINEALEHYHYNMLKITLDADVPNEMNGEVHLRGHVIHDGKELKLGLAIPF